MALTVERLEELSAELVPADQLRLVARITDRLCAHLATGPAGAESPDGARNARLELAQQLLAEVEDVENDAVGESDAAAAIRQMRDERMRQLCPKVV